VIVRDAEDQRGLALEQSHVTSLQFRRGYDAAGAAVSTLLRPLERPVIQATNEGPERATRRRSSARWNAR
jgi:hypothetical protein